MRGKRPCASCWGPILITLAPEAKNFTICTQLAKKDNGIKTENTESDGMVGGWETAGVNWTLNKMYIKNCIDV